ncbi:MAG: fluoride efflux transporter FluC, partial [Nocardioides sp.]
LLVALGAAVGAPLRLTLAHHLDGRWHRGTLVANVLGSFLLGLFTALALDAHTLALLGTGLCGGFTTYSSFAVQTHRLGARDGSGYAAVTVLASLGACALGFLLG